MAPLPGTRFGPVLWTSLLLFLPSSASAADPTDIVQVPVGISYELQEYLLSEPPVILGPIPTILDGGPNDDDGPKRLDQCIKDAATTLVSGVESEPPINYLNDPQGTTIRNKERLLHFADEIQQCNAPVATDFCPMSDVKDWVTPYIDSGDAGHGAFEIGVPVLHPLKTPVTQHLHIAVDGNGVPHPTC